MAVRAALSSLSTWLQPLVEEASSAVTEVVKGGATSVCTAAMGSSCRVSDRYCSRLLLETFPVSAPTVTGTKRTWKGGGFVTASCCGVPPRGHTLSSGLPSSTRLLGSSDTCSRAPGLMSALSTTAFSVASYRLPSTKVGTPAVTHRTSWLSITVPLLLNRRTVTRGR